MAHLGPIYFRSILRNPCSIIGGSLILGTIWWWLVGRVSSRAIGIAKDMSVLLPIYIRPKIARTFIPTWLMMLFRKIQHNMASSRKEINCHTHNLKSISTKLTQITILREYFQIYWAEWDNWQLIAWEQHTILSNRNEDNTTSNCLDWISCWMSLTMSIL